MFINLPIDANKNIYEACIMRKMHKLPFLKTSLEGKTPFQLVHANIRGLTCDLNTGEKKIFSIFH